MSRIILKLDKTLIINQNRKEYKSSFQDIIDELNSNGILRIVRDLNTWVDSEFICEDNTIFTLNSESGYGYFRIPVEIRYEQNNQSIQRNLELVLRTDNLYLQGFIITERQREIDINYYYHFDFTEIYEGRNYIHHEQNRLSENQRRLLQMWNRQPAGVRDNSVPLLTQIDEMQNRQLTRISPDYRDMISTENHNLNWQDIVNSFSNLLDFIDTNIGLTFGTLNELIPQSLGNIILVTAEALRFWSIHTHIIQELIVNNGNIVLQRNNNNLIYNTLTSWSEESNTISVIIYVISNLNSLEQRRNLLSNWIDSRIRGRNNQYLRDLLQEILTLSVRDLTNMLAHSNARILLDSPMKTLNNLHNRGRREVNDNYWHKKFCDLKPESDKIQGDITIIKIFENDSTVNQSIKKGDMLVGTTKGLYSINQVTTEKVTQKISTMKNEVKNIIISNDNSSYIINDKCEIYKLNLSDWSYKKTNGDKFEGKVTAIKILDENTKGGNLKAGDIYVGTNNGVYLIHGENQVHRFNELNFPIKDIILDGNGSAYVINEQGETYHLNLKGWGSEYIPNYQPSECWIEVWYKFGKPNQVKIKFSYNNLQEIYKSFIYKNKEKFIESLTTDLLNKIDKGGNREDYLEKEHLYNIARKSIYQNFTKFHSQSLNVKEGQQYIIDTFTDGDWHYDSDIIGNGVLKTKTEYVHNYQPSECWIEVWYKLIDSNEVKIIFSPYNLNEIYKVFIYSKKEDFIESLTQGLLVKIPKGGNEYFTQQHLYNIAHTVYDNFVKFHEKTFGLKSNQEYLFLTNTKGVWFELIVEMDKIRDKLDTNNINNLEEKPNKTVIRNEL